MPAAWSFETKQINIEQTADPATNALALPIYSASKSLANSTAGS